MCGLATIHISGGIVDEHAATMDLMLEQLQHRGPDGRGVLHIPGQLVMGHTRLAIIDVDHGAQPMQSANGRYALAYNGEIYNYVELREYLLRRGVHLRTFSDTEVLLELLIREGEQALGRLNGMFAFVFHDREANEWMAVRDPLGVKPLYFASVGDALVVASEIKALLCHPRLTAALNDRAMGEYLNFQFCLGDRTLFRGIHRVLPGHVLHGRGGEILRNSAFWSLRFEVDEDLDGDSSIELVRVAVEDAVRMQMRSDVAAGGYLSGGLDSSVVAALAVEHAQDEFPLFHGKFAEGPEFDESAHAQDVAEHLRSPLHTVVPTAQDFVEWLPKIAFAMDEPVAGPGVFPQFLVSRLASEHVKVVLGGQGGDELFGGYARYLVAYLEQALKGAILGDQEEGNHVVTLTSVVDQLPVLGSYFPMMQYFWADGLFGSMPERYLRLVSRLEGAAQYLTSDVLSSIDTVDIRSEFQSIFNDVDSPSYINKMLSFDMRTVLPGLLHVEDRASMYSSVESRVPLLDHRLVSLVASIPPQLKFGGGRPKHVLKRAARNVVPESILAREDKMGFPVPLAGWLRSGPVKEFAHDVLLGRAAARGIYSPVGLEKLLAEGGVASRQVWGALALELWFEAFDV